jgi:co-chaperonin GroES (HSP10)
MKLSIQPKGKFVLIQSIKPDAGAIALADYTAEDAKRVHQQGMAIFRVLAVGEGRMASDGTIVPIELKAGDEVILAPDTVIATPHQLLYDMSDQHIVDVGAVVAVVHGREGNKLPLRLPEILKPSKQLVH